jgi:iron complex outermembrane recepter protein
MSHSSNIRHAVRYTLAAAAFASAYAVPATAQTELEEVVVTGSRIARADYDAASPVITLDQELFKLSGETQLETVLNSMPQLVPSITTTSNNPSNGGQANVDLRGLGTARTLVLLDGTRLTPSNNSGVVDLNTIPSALIQNIEILTGGASSTYGSDAVAGVVNVRMRQNFEGVQVNTQYGITDKSDGQTFLVEGLIGGNFADDRGNAVMALSYDSRDEVLAGDRGFGEVSLGAQLQPLGSGAVPDGRIDWGTNAPSQAALNAVFGAYGAAPGQVPPASAIGFNTDGTLFAFGRGTAAQPVINYRGNTNDPGFNPLSYSYNYGPVNYLQLPLTRRQIAGFASYDIVPDVAEVYSRIMYTTYNSDQQLASTPVTCGGTLQGCAMPITNPLIPADLRTLIESRATPGAALPASAFSRRYNESGPRVSENQYDVTQGLIGVRGSLPNDWRWDVFSSWGRTQYTNLQGGNLSRSRLQAAYNNPAVYAAQGCAQFNPFGAGNVSPACANAVTIKATNIQENTQIQTLGSLSGSLYDLPAGPLQFAAGAEYRKNTGDFRPDQFLASGDVVGFNAQQPISGEISVTEGFAELAVPILKDLPGVNYLALDLGYRYSDYNLAGEHSTYKVALAVDPIESLKVRGSYNRAIRAPSIGELFLPQQENFPQYSDPCNFNSTFRTGPDAAAVTALCQAQGIPAATLPTFTQLNPQARSFVGGNLDLEPGDGGHLHGRHRLAVAGRQRLGEQPERVGGLLELRDRGRDQQPRGELDHRPLLQPARLEPDLRREQRVLPVVHAQHGQLRRPGRGRDQPEPRGPQARGRGPAGGLRPAARRFRRRREVGQPQLQRAVHLPDRGRVAGDDLQPVVRPRRHDRPDGGERVPGDQGPCRDVVECRRLHVPIHPALHRRNGRGQQRRDPLAVDGREAVGGFVHVPRHFGPLECERHDLGDGRRHQHRRQGSADLHDQRAGGYPVQHRPVDLRRAGTALLHQPRHQVLTSS